MIKNSSNICSTWYSCIVCIVFISVFSVNTTSAQNHLTPGYSTSSQDYQQALKTVFSEAYESGVRLRVQFTGKYRIENMTGVRSDSTGHHIFHIKPIVPVYTSSYVSTPCTDSDGNELPERAGRRCSKLDFSSADTIQVNTFQTAIDSSLAYLLTSLWEEMLIQSKYKPKFYISTGGVSYQYSASASGHGTIYAYTDNPLEDTFTGTLAAISELMKSAATAETDMISDSLINQIEARADKLMGELLSFGDGTPSRYELNRAIKGCESEYRKVVENTYCWQAYLTNDETPTLLIANKKDGKYVFELVDFTNQSNFRKTHVLPVKSLVNIFKRDDPMIQWEYYLMEPWDIIDLITNTMNGDFQVFGYKNFTLGNENFQYSKDTAIIHFDGVVPSRDMRVKLDIDGESGWFTVKDLFNGD